MTAEVNAEAIPEELRQRDQWLMWDSSADAPRRPHWAGDFSVSWNDPGDWHSFEEAIEAAKRRESWGIGYVLANGIDDYPRGVYGGLDLDGVAEDGEPKDWLPSLDTFFDADDPYVEWSPSGTGLHIILAGFEPPEWWSDCLRGDHEGVEAESAKFFTVTGNQLRGSGDTIGDDGEHVEAWLADVWEAVRDEPAPPRRDDDDDESGGETAAVPSQAAGNAEDIARAVDRLDAQRVAERTIVDAWNDDAPTSDGARAFYPSWGGADCNGTANIVGDDVWTDTGGGGKGGVQVMAAIDMGELNPRSATPDAVTGDLWWATVEHLRDLGFAIPAYEPPSDPEPTTAAAETVAGQSETDGGAVAAGGGDGGGPMSLADRVRARVLTPLDPPEDYDGEEITLEVGINRFADLLCEEYDFVRPREDVRGWRDRLYIYQADEGIYEPHAESWVATEAERLLGAVSNNQRVREIVKKIERREAVEPGDLVAPAHRLVVANGIVDLHTGELHEHTPDEHHRTKLDLGENDFAASDLEGKLANLHPDMASETVRELDTFKKVTGRDTMTADVKYESPVHFENSATMIFAANRMPRMTEDTHALWRRWIYINFPYTFNQHDPEAKDPVPKRKLMDELTDPAQMRGLLARAVEELTRWWDEHTLFTETATPEQVRTKMKRASEPIYDFAMTCLEPADEDEWLPKGQVRDCYREFAKAEDLPTVADNQFGERLLNIRDLPIESGQRRDDNRRVTAYTGVAFSSRGRQVLGLDEDSDTPSVDDGHKHAWEVARDEVERLTDGLDGPQKGEVVGSLSRQMSLTNAQQAFDSAAERGAIYNDGDGWKTT